MFDNKTKSMKGKEYTKYMETLNTYFNNMRTAEEIEKDVDIATFSLLPMYIYIYIYINYYYYYYYLFI